jgi:serine/threonine-protein kinase RsbW
MAVQQTHIRITARLEEIGRANQHVWRSGVAAGLGEKDLHHCQLAVDEACTNIVEHGYRGGQADAFIDIYCRIRPGLLTIEIIDSSPPYNPLARSRPDPTSGLDERGVGGWGVYFITHVMQDVIYRYADGKNHLSMSKRSSTGPAETGSLGAGGLY